MSRKNVLIFGFLASFFLGAGMYYFSGRKNQSKPVEKPPEVKLIAYEDKTFGFKLKYPEGFVVGKIAEKDQENDPLMLKLVRENPPTLVLYWKEGLGVVEAFIKKPLLEYLKDNIDRKFTAEYNDFKKEKVEETDLAGLSAFTVWFTFQDPKKSYREKIKLTVTQKNSVGYYLSCMAPEPMWEFAEPSCDIIKEGLEFL